MKFSFSFSAWSHAVSRQETSDSVFKCARFVKIYNDLLLFEFQNGSPVDIQIHFMDWRADGCHSAGIPLPVFLNRLSGLPSKTFFFSGKSFIEDNLSSLLWERSNRKNVPTKGSVVEHHALTYNLRLSFIFSIESSQKYTLHETRYPQQAKLRTKVFSETLQMDTTTFLVGLCLHKRCDW